MAVEELLARVVPGWEPAEGLGFSIALASIAMWGVMGMIQRNVELARAQETIAELAVQGERSRFARDLHDILGHSLTVLTVKAELAGRLVSIDPQRAEREIGEVEQLARQALTDVRAAVSGYREVSLPGELASARTALEAAGIAADLPGTVDDLPAERRELMAWTVREGVTNVVRHSGARRAWVRLWRDGVEVADDGRGPLAPDGRLDGGSTGIGQRARPGGAARAGGRRGRGRHGRPARRRRLRPAGALVSAPIRLLLADDQALVRGAMASLLGLEPDLEVVAEVGRGDEVVAAARSARPDVALLDVEMPGLDGIGATRELRAAVPACRVLVVTTFGRPGYLRRALEAGASGFVVKDTPARQLADAVRRVHSGLRVVDPALAAESLAAGSSPLTARETDVLRAARDGGTVADLAAALHLSEGTVRNHLSSAIGKTGARTRAEAVRLADEAGWLL